MAITKLTMSGFKPSTFNKYDDFLAGNAAYIPKPVVTGGTLTSDSTYYYRTFTGNGTLTITGGTVSCDLLTIAGGVPAAVVMAAAVAVQVTIKVQMAMIHNLPLELPQSEVAVVVQVIVALKRD